MMQNFRDIDTTAVSVALRIVYAGMYVFTVLSHFTYYTHTHTYILYTRMHTHTHPHAPIYIDFIVSGKTPREGAVGVINCAVNPKLISKQAHHYITGKYGESVSSQTSR